MKFSYTPTRPRWQAARQALQNILRTFFDDSTKNAMATLLDMSDRFSDGELQRLRGLIDQAAKAKS